MTSRNRCHAEPPCSATDTSAARPDPVYRVEYGRIEMSDLLRGRTEGDDFILMDRAVSAPVRTAARTHRSNIVYYDGRDLLELTAMLFEIRERGLAGRIVVFAGLRRAEESASYARALWRACAPFGAKVVLENPPAGAR